MSEAIKPGTSGRIQPNDGFTKPAAAASSFAVLGRYNNQAHTEVRARAGEGKRLPVYKSSNPAGCIGSANHLQNSKNLTA